MEKLLDKLFCEVRLTCNLCGEEIFSEEYFCKDCLKQLPFNDGAICSRCGRKTPNSTGLCLSCKGENTYFDIARSLFLYKYPINNMIQNFKYNNFRYLAELFAYMMKDVYLKEFFNADIIVAVPMQEKDEEIRGFNQSQLLAEKLSEFISVPVSDEVIIKKKQTPHQVGLDKKHRLKNLESVFKVCNKELIKDKRVLLVDDVLTTGATSMTVSKKLKEGGASAVFLLTIASVDLSK